MEKKHWYLGNTKGKHSEAIYLEDFTWDCGWYWGGGYIGNKNMHCHFNGCFLEVPDIRGHPLGNFVTPWTVLNDHQKGARIIENGCSVWEPLTTFLSNAQYTEKRWWRIKDLFKQFYIFRAAAEAFRHGGHCSGDSRTPGEIKPSMAKDMNLHIEHVIIPAIRSALNKEEPVKEVAVLPMITSE